MNRSNRYASALAGERSGTLAKIGSAYARKAASSYNIALLKVASAYS